MNTLQGDKLLDCGKIIDAELALPDHMCRLDTSNWLLLLNARHCRKLFKLPVGAANMQTFGARCGGRDGKMIDFKGVHYPKAVILHAVFFYVRCAVSYRDLEEILAERGITVDHATLIRWVVKFAPLIAVRAQRRKHATAPSWRMDETYIKVKGKWTYLCRAVDRDG